MNSTGLVKYASSLIALAVCAACGGAPTGAPSAGVPNYQYIGKTLFVNGRPVTAARLSAMPRYATILPEHHSKAKTFEYIINDYTTYAGVFDYPKSDAEIGRITNVGGQGCTNVLDGYGKKILWIVAAENQIEEFEVPKKPLKTLSDSIGMPSSCAMDTSGDLAVGILAGSGSGDVVIYKGAGGSGTVFVTPLADEYFDGYDNNGNLFADGFNHSGKVQLVELPNGSSKFEAISTSNTLQFPGSVQWDGKYLTVFDQLANATYQYTVSGTKATLQGTVSYLGSSDCAQTWIVKGLVYCGDAGNDDGEVFKYPAGGSPVAAFTGNFDFPLGVTASEK